jgi:hypothetical protein
VRVLESHQDARVRERTFMQPRLTRAAARTMTETSALTRVILAFRQNERDAVLLALETVSDLKEITLTDFSQLKHTQTAATAKEASDPEHLNKL